MSYREPLELRSFLKTIVFALVAVITLSYIPFQARFLIIGPVVEITNETKPVYNEQIILIEGKAQNITDITLNDQPIYTDEKGNFSESLVLEDGYTIMTIRAHDRYGRETHLTRSFVYRPASSVNI